MSDSHSQQVESLPPPVVWKEFVRGAKFGAMIAGLIMGFVGSACLVIAPIRPAAGDADLRNMAGLIQAIGGLLGGALLAAFYGSVVGALVIGSRAVIKSRRRSRTGRLS